VIPLVCTIRVQRPDGRLRRFWIPLFLLWPFILVLFVAAEILVILACTVLLFIWPRDAVKIALALPALLYLLMQTGGFQVEIAETNHPRVVIELS
jgi:hypothetical protein